MKATLLAALCALPAFASGCDGDDCVIGEVRCHDNGAEICDLQDSGEGPTRWRREDCGPGVCMDGIGEEPFCALATEPDPRCESAPDGSSCDGGERVVCKQGFATTSSEDCARDGRFCVIANDDAVCALEPEPNELCSPGWDGDGCDGEQLVRCRYGYIVYRFDCEAQAQSCVVTPEFAFCNASSEPDPLCPPEEYPAHMCEGNVVVGCAYGYRTGESACGSNSVCREDNVGYSTAGCFAVP